MSRKPLPIGAPQPWPPPSPAPPSNGDNKIYTDCTQQICTITCLQFCNYLPFEPPPPYFTTGGDDEDGSGSRISPLMAALIAVLAAAFLLLFYFTVVSRYCRFRRRNRQRRRFQISDDVTSSEIRIDPMVLDTSRPAGLDESFIRQITVFKFRRNDGLIDGTECSICLSEFKEEESLRLMPNCEHAFHIPCIDTWLVSHSSCPLCRATMLNPVQPPVRVDVSVVAMMQVQRRDDDVLVVTEEEGEVIVCHEVVLEGTVDGEEIVTKGDP